MSAFNAEKYLEKSIESILNQTLTDFEFLIVDDASIDSTSKILEKFSKKDSRVRIIKNKKNIGLTKSLNIALKEATGEYIARMDADDISCAGRFEKQVEFLDSKKEYILVGTFMKIIDETGHEINHWDADISNDEIKENLIKYNPMFHPTIMVRKSVLLSVGGYNENWRYAQDYELYFRLVDLGKMYNLPEYLVKYRFSKNSITASKNTKQSLCALLAMWSGIKHGHYPWYKVVYLVRPIVGIVLPKFFKDLYKQ